MLFVVHSTLVLVQVSIFILPDRWLVSEDQDQPCTGYPVPPVPMMMMIDDFLRNKASLSL